MSTEEPFATLVCPRLIEVRHRIETAAKKAGRNPADVTLIGVTKSLPIEKIPYLENLEMNHFAENRPQELWRRQPLVPRASWHLIGPLQRNKVAQTLPHASLIHSVDSLRLIGEIEKESRKKGATTPILLQINGSREPQKGGFNPEDLSAMVPFLADLKNIRLEGLMTMAAYSEEPEKARPVFAMVREMLNGLRNEWKTDFHPLNQLSMGMSGDFEVAIEEGATLVRVGSALFGEIS